MLIGIGILHFVAPKPFDTIVPAELPGSRGSTPTPPASGELATGALLLAPRTRRLGALAAIALFVAVFPANVQHGAVVVGQAAGRCGWSRLPVCRCRSR